MKVFSSTGRPLTEFLATSTSDRNGVQVGVAADREGQPRIAALVGSGGSKQVRLFDSRSSGAPAPLASYRAVGTGTLATPGDRSEVKRFDAANPIPRTSREPFRHRAAGVLANGYSAFLVRYGDGVGRVQLLEGPDGRDATGRQPEHCLHQCQSAGDAEGVPGCRDRAGVAFLLPV